MLHRTNHGALDEMGKKIVRKRNYAVLAVIVLGRCAVRTASNPWGDGPSEGKDRPSS